MDRLVLSEPASNFMGPDDTMPAGSMDDLLIRGGHLIDGTGGPGHDADVAVREGRIAAVEPRSADPHQYATGVSTVVVNGEVVIDAGDHTGALPGRVLRRCA